MHNAAVSPVIEKDLFSSETCLDCRADVLMQQLRDLRRQSFVKVDKANETLIKLLLKMNQAERDKICYFFLRYYYHKYLAIYYYYNYLFLLRRV